MSYKFTPIQEELCEALRDLGIDQELAEVILTILDEDEKVDEYLDWLVENQGNLVKPVMLEKALEVDNGGPLSI